MLTTRQKITLARTALRGVMAMRSLTGQGYDADVVRRNVRWRLDLREGIDFSIWLLGAFERRTVLAYERLIRPGDTALDIGANIGAHTLYLARAVGPQGQVHAFEPTDYAFQKLEANIALNPELAGRIICRQTMLVDRGTKAPMLPLYSSWPLDPAADLHALHMGRLMPASNATAIDLDSYVDGARLTRVDFIKLDIDGFECGMLRGATATLRKFRPTILLELSPHQLAEAGSSIDDLVAILGSAGYGLHRISPGAPLPMSGEKLRSIIPHGGSCNAIARPLPQAP